MSAIITVYDVSNEKKLYFNEKLTVGIKKYRA